MKRIVLMGNPNVGKSALFARLTGVRMISSNYPGTTVEFTSGKVKIGPEFMEIIDAPGTYSLEPACKAEEVAAHILPAGDVVINAVDATQLERNLFLTMALLKFGKPVVIALNMADEAHHKGIRIDAGRLEKILGVPVVETCAISGEGIKQLAGRLADAKANSFPHQDHERWQHIGNIIQQVQSLKHHHHTLLEIFSDLTLHPATGILFALLVVLACFQVVRWIGEGFITLLLDPFFNVVWQPWLMRLSGVLGPDSWLHYLLIGKLFHGQINYAESLGLLSTGIYVPLAMVLPYVFAFFLVLGILEDTGYLPRLGILLDAPLHRLGLHGFAIIPLLLGGGCHVPGILSTRMLESRPQRVVTAMLITICIPCMGQTAMIYGFLAGSGALGPFIIFATLAVAGLGLALIAKAFNRAEIPEMFVEIPPYRLPGFRMLSLKVGLRTRQFLLEALPYVLLGVLIMNVLYSLQVIKILGNLAAPITTGILGLPADTTASLLLGFLRKDVSVGMLAPLGLDFKQSVIACVVLVMQFPCIATLVILLREFGTKDTLAILTIMFIMSLAVGGMLNLLL
ncbi:ferrous iron transporter B [candidate division FCPU426 bacterium]|nr:ferrous iron transporter B [candidate division FCPU426 bacterium]